MMADSTLDPEKFVASLRKHFALPTRRAPYLRIDKKLYNAIGDQLFAEVVIGHSLVVELDEDLLPGIIPDSIGFSCKSLRKAMSDQRYIVENLQNGIDAVLSSVPVLVTLSQADKDLLEEIDLTSITNQRDLPSLMIKLFVSHKQTKWQSDTSVIELRSLYTQQALKDIWADSQPDAQVKFREFF